MNKRIGKIENNKIVYYTPRVHVMVLGKGGIKNDVVGSTVSGGDRIELAIGGIADEVTDSNLDWNEGDTVEFIRDGDFAFITKIRSIKTCTRYKLSNCCGARIIEDNDICSDCKEHCETTCIDCDHPCKNKNDE